MVAFKAIVEGPKMQIISSPELGKEGELQGQLVMDICLNETVRLRQSESK